MSADLALPSSERVRAALVERRVRLVAAWSGPAGDLGDGIVLVASGLVLAVEGTDHQYAFRAHDEHYYLAGSRLPGQVLVFDPSGGDGEAGWVLFAHVPTADERVWTGTGPDLDAQAERTGIPRVRPVEELAAWLASRGGRAVALLGSLDLLERPAGYTLHPEQVAALQLDADLTQRVQGLVVAARRRKDEVELAFLRAAAVATRAGHLAGLSATAPGRTERSLQGEIDAAMVRAGAERTAYASIAVAGANCAVLHATPGNRLLAAGDLVLVDAGAEVEGYDSDVTRTWPVDARFDGEQRALYELVLSVQEGAIREARAGVEFRDLHLRTARAIAQGLVDFGLLRGSADALVDRDAHALFFPHGLGHLLGLATHDVGGLLPGRARSERPGLKYLRADLPLEVGYVLTIEPGIYLVPALLQDEALRRRYADAVVWDRADAMLDFGGVRIEDDVRITEGEPEVITASIPKAVDEIEALRGTR